MKNYEEIDPLSILGKHCYTEAAIKIESIFIGQSISLQVKLYEAHIDLIKPKNEKNKKLFRPKSNPIVKFGYEDEDKDEDEDKG